MCKKYFDKTKELLDCATFPEYSAVNEYASIMAERYSFLRVSSIGESVLAKKIYMFALGNEKAKKSVLYVASQDGTQWLTTLMLMRFINELCEYYRRSKLPFGINLSSLFTGRCIKFVIQPNPDGAEIHLKGVEENNILYDRLMKMSGGDFSNWHSNARGVDLCLNYGAAFGFEGLCEKERSINAGPYGYCGEYPMSEPESCAISSYIKYDGSISMLLELEGYGESIAYFETSVSRAAESLSNLSGYKKERLDADGSYTSGSVGVWFAKEFGKPAFVVRTKKPSSQSSAAQYYSAYAQIREMLTWAPLLC